MSADFWNSIIANHAAAQMAVAQKAWQHRGWEISEAYIGYWFQHPKFDPENPSDWRYGHASSVQEARDEIDRLLAEDEEWDEAVNILRAAIAKASGEPS